MKYKYSEIKNYFHNREPWLNVFVFSIITKPLTFAVVNFTQITPNHISLLSLSFGLGSAYCIAVGNIHLGVLLYFISYVFDAIDGKVARIKKNGKVYGGWMDILIDRINLTLISSAISLNYYNNTQDVSIFLLNMLFLGLAFIGWESRYNIDLFSIKRGLEQPKEIVPTGGYAKWTYDLGLDLSPISLVEVFLFYLMVSPVFGWELEAQLFAIFMLCVRLIMQQKFWYEASNQKK